MAERGYRHRSVGVNNVRGLDLHTWEVLAASGASVSVTGTTTETTLATIPVPAKAMGPNGVLRITALWTYPNTANIKTLRHRFGGTAFNSQPMTTTAMVQTFVMIRNANSEIAQKALNLSNTTPFATSTGTPMIGAVDTRIAQNLTISGLLANTGETITLESYIVELMRA